jgi:glycosyltransferase involved in cell wall biosynthesis
MKVVYDISYLGCGLYIPSARTGIFRVVENVAHGLLNSKECEVAFCAGDSLQRLNESLDYLELDSRFTGISISHSRFKRSLYKKQFGFNARVSKALGHEFADRALRRILYSTSEMIGKFSEPIDAGILDGAHVFHSPWSPLPRQVTRAGNLQKFLTVYDKFHLKLLRSLEPDVWPLCISESTKNDLCDYLKFDPARVFVTPLAASPHLFYQCTDKEKITAVKKKYRIADAPYFLSLNTWVPRKNIEHSIRCFARTVAEHKIKDLYFVLVGAKGFDYEKIFETISACPAAKHRIIIAGYVADDDLAALYSGALAFLYPSLYEGFGLPPLEAMQCGVPVITSNTSSLPEVVGDAGIMLDPADADGLCHSMNRIYAEPTLRETMALKSSERAKLFTWEKCVEETIRAYKVAVRT